MKYEHEIYQMIKDSLYESWMEDSDWDKVIDAISKDPRFNLKKMESDIDIGIKNGYSLEFQMNLCKDIFLSIKNDGLFK